jgi:site-specific recombinase XerD
MPDKQSDSVKKEFINYLNSLGLSSISLKNYRSDLVHFVAWAILKVRSLGSYVESLTEIVPFLSSDLGREYTNFMTKNAVPVKTMNRRLSTLRHLSRFLLESHVIESDFTKGIENVSTNSVKKAIVNPVSDNFREYLVNEKVSPNTIKNYLSDIRHFLTWLESNQKTSKVWPNQNLVNKSTN